MLSCKQPTPFTVLMPWSHSAPEGSRAPCIRSGHNRLNRRGNIINFINSSIFLWFQKGFATAQGTVSLWSWSREMMLRTKRLLQIPTFLARHDSSVPSQIATMEENYLGIIIWGAEHWLAPEQSHNSVLHPPVSRASKIVRIASKFRRDRSFQLLHAGSAIPLRPHKSKLL